MIHHVRNKAGILFDDAGGGINVDDVPGFRAARDEGLNEANAEEA